MQAIPDLCYAATKESGIRISFLIRKLNEDLVNACNKLETNKPSHKKLLGIKKCDEPAKVLQVIAFLKLLEIEKCDELAKILQVIAF